MVGGAEDFVPADVVEQAARLVVRSFMGFGSDGARQDIRTGFRANSNRSGSTPAQDWANFPDALRAIVGRVRGIAIENRDAVDCMAQHDSPTTLHYVDPPYLPDTRSLDHRNHGYAHELTEADHVRLLPARDLRRHPARLAPRRAADLRRRRQAPDGSFVDQPGRPAGGGAADAVLHADRW